MTLEALAPDQRAVVQLVLQQERTYDELAGLLGISSEAVRDRAHAGLARLADAGDLTAEERGELTDYLLGQQSVSRREATRGLLASSSDARSWARAVADELEDVARSPLPEVPDEDGDDVGPAAPAIDPAPETTTVAVDDLDLDEDEDDEEDEYEPAATPAATAPALGRPRPRPRQPDRTGLPLGGPAPAKPRNASMLGGMLLLLGMTLMIATVILYFTVLKDDDEPGRAGNGDATPTATATPAVQPAGAIDLKAPGGGKARGRLTLYISEEGQVAFTLEGTDVPPSKEGEAYAVWLTGGDRPRRLGFAPPVAGSGEDKGRLGTSGPREQDAASFPKWFSDAKNVIVARETTQDATRPGPTVLTGKIPGGGEG